MTTPRSTGATTETVLDWVRKWDRDGHAARVLLDGDALRIELTCPNQDIDCAGVEWDHLPGCRRPWTEDGQPDREEPALRFCNYREYVENSDLAPIEYVDLSVMDRPFLALGEFPIGWRWEPADQVYLWAPSTLIEKHAPTKARR